MRIEPGQWLRAGGVRARIGLAFSLLALVLFGVFGVLSAHQARRVAERDVTDALQQLADRLAQLLDADMAERFHEVNRLAALERLLDIEVEQARWRRLLERLQGSMKHYSWIGLAAVDGRVQVATQGLLEGRDVRARPWFGKGLQQPSVGDVHEAQLLASLLSAAATREPQRFVDVSTPLLRGGQVVGVIGAHLSWAWAEDRRRELLAVTAADRRIEIVLTDRAGAVLLGPAQPALAAAGSDAAAVLAAAPGLRVWADGAPYLTATSPSRASGDYPGMGWTVVVRQPESSAFAAASALQHRLWLLGGAGALLFGMLGWVLADRLTAPLRALALRSRGLDPTGGSVVAHDEVAQLAGTLGGLIDGLRAREQALQSANDSLEARVRARTAALQQANEDLCSFSRSVSHDLRGPLSGMAMLLRQTLDRDGAQCPPRAQRTLTMLAAECDRLHLLTGDLLTLAMVEQRDLATVPLDSAALVAEVVDHVVAAATAVQPTVQVGPLPEVMADPVLLRQVWVNLLSNAVKFSSKVAAPRVDISASVSGGEVVFCVADNGAGFDSARAERLFGVFQRLHSGSEFPGTGVGLSIVKRVVHRHGGRVWAESAPGRGARFYFALSHTVRQRPVSPDAATPAPAPAAH